MAIYFHFQNVKDLLKQKRKHKEWVRSVIEFEKKQCGDINFIFCDDQHLLSLNQKHLNHNTLTDIITFDLSDDPNIVQADIFISLDRVQDNAQKFETTTHDELRRVMIHGVLHVLGLNDKTERDKRRMRSAEDKALAQFS